MPLNLLPPSEKKETGSRERSRLLVFYGGAIFSLFAAFAVLMVFIWLFLSVRIMVVNRQIAAEEKSSLYQEVKKMESEIGAVNQNLKIIDQLQSSRKKYSASLEELASITPVGVQFSNFFFDTKTGKATLDGFALTRNDFLSFLSLLERNSGFSEIDSPISNLIRSGNNNFRVSFKIKR